MQLTRVFKPLFIGVVLSAALAPAMAQTKLDYWRDARGNLIKSGFGECVRAVDWTPADALAECEGKVAPSASTLSLSSDGLFAFGKAQLLPAGTEALKSLADRLSGRHLVKLTVTGHSDRLGSAATNKTLSQRRAQAVKTYLSSQGIAASVIDTAGAGSSQPKTTAEQCPGKQRNAELIACLAPDRRVDIEVIHH